MSRLLFLSVVFLAIGCKTPKQSTANNLPIIMMEKTACMGTCPVYKFNVYADGSATYTGTQHVDQIGNFKATLTESQLTELKNSFEKANFFSFANVYSANMTDLPTTFIYYRNDKQDLKITDYYGAPEALKALEKKVEAFIATIDWQEE